MCREAAAVPGGTNPHGHAPYQLDAAITARGNTGVDVDQRTLVERAQRGDHEAFAALAADAIARLDAAARLILRDPDLARDAVQEACIRAWRDLPWLRDPDKFDAWLHRLTVNACLDVLRRRKRRPVEVELTPVIVASVDDASSLIAQRDSLDRALRALEPEWRAIVVLHYYLGMPLPEVADALGIRLGTAKSRLHRSLSILRSVMVLAEAPATARVPEGQYA
jgi:RNA polymerase sigma-70 factor, ECF subfamily